MTDRNRWVLTGMGIGLLAVAAALPARGQGPDFDGDGFDDLPVGVPFGVRSEDVGSVVRAGAVSVIYGTASGRSATENELWHQDIARIQDAAETGDFLGAVLTK